MEDSIKKNTQLRRRLALLEEGGALLMIQMTEIYKTLFIKKPLKSRNREAYHQNKLKKIKELDDGKNKPWNPMKWRVEGFKWDDKGKNFD